tara:strand:+ start:4963 stop:5589 length:627 start_codon:yes stop_codon:yes gene_type:complete
MQIVKESCVESLSEALKAEQNGADRIELCSRLDLGGLTPNRELIRHVSSRLSIPIKVMIRPRAGNFIYNAFELEQMKDDILFCRSVDVKGVVFGILDNKKSIDVKSTRALTTIAKRLEVTFHKAIDEVFSIFDALDILMMETNISAVLTSGGEKSAESGVDILKKMVQKAKNKLTIIPAGSITDQNIDILHSAIGASEYHGRKIIDIS